MPTSLVTYIDKAASINMHPNDRLVMAVSSAITVNPYYVEPIVAHAVEIAPAERGYLIDKIMQKFPSHANRIMAGANVAPPQAVQASAPQGYIRQPVYTAPSQPAVYAPQPRYAPLPRQAAPRQVAAAAPPAPPSANDEWTNADLKRKAGKGYVTFGIAYKFLKDTELDNVSGAQGDLGFKKGLFATLSSGYRFKSGLRGEFEAAYHRNITDTLDGAGLGHVEADRVQGNITTHAIMMNAYYDLPFQFYNDRVTPYFGGGAGYARVKINFTGDPVSIMDDVYAYQGMAGVEFAIAPGIAINGMYKYFATEDLDFGATKAKHKSQNIALGLVFDF